MTISTIIPVYNTAPYLRRCINSIQNNTYKDLEIICINDGSNDDSLAVLMELAEEDSRISVITMEHGGVSSARNVGLAHATGDYVTFIDSDDWIHPHYFETLLYFKDRLEVDCVACHFDRVSKESETFDAIDYAKVEYSVKGKGEAVNDGAIKNCVCGHLYSRELLKERFFPEGVPVGEDAIFNMEWMTKTDAKIAVLNERLYYYYYRPGSTMGTMKSREWVIPFVDWYLRHIPKEKDESVQGFYLLEVMKKLLAARYSVMFEKEQKEFKSYCREGLKICSKNMWQNRALSWKKKMVFETFVRVPQLYRLWKNIDDPTMREWEKAQKRMNS